MVIFFLIFLLLLHWDNKWRLKVGSWGWEFFLIFICTHIVFFIFTLNYMVTFIRTNNVGSQKVLQESSILSQEQPHKLERHHILTQNLKTLDLYGFFIYNLFNFRFFKQCRTTNSLHICHNNLPLKCESPNYMPTLKRKLIHIHLYLTIDTHS